MPETPDKQESMRKRELDAGQRALDYGITIFNALQKHTENHANTAAAISAIVSILSESIPGFSEKYERYVAESLETSPEVRTSRLIVEGFAKIENELKKARG